MPAFESRRVRTQPFTVTGASCGAFPARTSRTLHSLLSMGRESLFELMALPLSKRRSTFRRHRAWAAILADGNISENTLGHCDLLLADAAPHPALDLHRDRGSAD